ncbi:hypothetical protein ACJ72_08808 [Emergomyces africanus]|uniref:Uncharacterized protein n=1 Tax=Emergomyces africanus TaxID=1955775 RepID=A0A1B7NJ53_9EURO|nr:hypothetical protein ACJ72_08808 [Emergomyces africanus]
MLNGDDEEAVAGIGDTGQSIVPRQKRTNDSETTARLDERRVGRQLRCQEEVAKSKHQECQIESDEHETECHGGFECADKEDGCENPPTLKSVGKVRSVYGYMLYSI